MFDALYPKEQETALNTQLEFAAQQAAQDRQMCDGLPTARRVQNKTCILMDDPAQGWEVVQSMERQEMFLAALPAILGGVIVLAALYVTLTKFSALTRRKLGAAGTALGAHFNNPIRLLQWMLAFIGATSVAVLWKLLK